MFGIGGFEFLLIVVFVLLVFGPEKMPEIGRTIGRGIKMFNDARSDVEKVVRTEILRPEDVDTFRQLGGAGLAGANRPSGSHTVTPGPSTIRDAVVAKQAEVAAEVASASSADSATGAAPTAPAADVES